MLLRSVAKIFFMYFGSPAAEKFSLTKIFSKLFNPRLVKFGDAAFSTSTFETPGLEDCYLYVFEDLSIDL